MFPAHNTDENTGVTCGMSRANVPPVFFVPKKQHLLATELKTCKKKDKYLKELLLEWCKGRKKLKAFLYGKQNKCI
jgi:hypothetical protein